jgi:propanol-preferring alcohol dehydrogenase
MRALRVRAPRPAEDAPLELCEEPRPEPAAGEVRVRVEACGVCRTDLHVAEGDLPPQRASVVPGHEVVGRVDALGPGAHGFREGDRAGVAWLHRACGTCRFCARGAENLCLAPRFTGWHADGGYADWLVAPAEFVYHLPDAAPAEPLAPLLCAGIIGYRAYVLSGVRPGERLGLFGFGGSAHIVIQLARHRGNEVYVWSRDEGHQTLARELGAAWVGATGARAPAPVSGAILFAPAGELVLPALLALDRGGTLAVAGIHLSAIPPLDYHTHLFQERALRSVTANTRSDGRELLRLAEEVPLRTHTVPYPLEQANRALVDLKQDRIRGAAVLRVADGPVVSTGGHSRV